MESEKAPPKCAARGGPKPAGTEDFEHAFWFEFESVVIMRRPQRVEL